jgi:hypothetical protein
MVVPSLAARNLVEGAPDLTAWVAFPMFPAIRAVDSDPARFIPGA